MANIPPDPHKPTSSFHRINLSPVEAISGAIFNSMQIAVIQNLRVDIAEQKLALKFTPNDVLDYTQQESFLTGQLEILQYLIDSSQAAQSNAIQSTQQSNKQE